MTVLRPQMWWSNITGPQSLVRKVVDTLADARSAVLVLPDDCPWRSELRDIIIEEMRDDYALGTSTVSVLDPDETVANGPADILLGHFALEEVAHRYRMSVPLEKYLLTNEVLKNKIVWLTAIEDASIEQWASFISTWTPRDTHDGLFVLELSQSQAHTQFRKSHRGIEIIGYEDCIGDYSASLFNSMIVDDASPKGTPASLKRYLAALLTRLCEGDVEVSNALSDNLPLLGQNPLEAVFEVAEFFSTSHGASDEGHVLSLVRARNVDELSRRVWEAQVEVLFSLLETRRLSVVTRLGERLNDLVESGKVEQYGTRVTDVEDIEPGTLVYLMSALDENGMRKLYVPEEDLRQEIHLIRDCRNALAHHKACAWPQVATLLQQ